MENLHFTDEAIYGLIIQGILMIVLPVVLLVIWKIKTKESIIPVIIGAVTWFVFAIILKLAPAYFLLYGDNPVAKTISGNVWYTMILAGVLAGVFEETGRFLAFKFVLKNNTGRRTSLSYGIGHGGFESVYVGFQMIITAVMGILINGGMADQIFGNADPAMLETALGQIDKQANLTIGECLLGVFERIPAIAGHISFSVLVFAAVRERRFRYLYPTAIVLHALMDFSTVFYSAGIVEVWAMELILFIFAAVMATFAYWTYRQLDERKTETA